MESLPHIQSVYISWASPTSSFSSISSFSGPLSVVSFQPLNCLFIRHRVPWGRTFHWELAHVALVPWSYSPVNWLLRWIVLSQVWLVACRKRHKTYINIPTKLVNGNSLRSWKAESQEMACLWMESRLISCCPQKVVCQHRMTRQSKSKGFHKRPGESLQSGSRSSLLSILFLLSKQRFAVTLWQGENPSEIAWDL